MSVGDVSVGVEKVTPMAVRCQQIFIWRKKMAYVWPWLVRMGCQSDRIF